MNVKILSWNIWFGKYLNKVKDFLKNYQADIIGLQEVTQSPEGKNNIAEKLAKELDYFYVYATGMDLSEYGEHLVMGNAVLSKYPIVSNKAHQLAKTNSRVVIQADIKIENTVLHVLSTHFIHTHQKPSTIQIEQARDLLIAMPKKNVIVMGDFNATPESKAIQLISKSLRNADSKSTQPTWSVFPEGCEVCLPKGLDIRLDYIFRSYDIKQKLFTIHNSDGSDHLPISLVIKV